MCVKSGPSIPDLYIFYNIHIEEVGVSNHFHSFQVILMIFYSFPFISSWYMCVKSGPSIPDLYIFYNIHIEKVGVSNHFHSFQVILMIFYSFPFISWDKAA